MCAGLVMATIPSITFCPRLKIVHVPQINLHPKFIYSFSLLNSTMIPEQPLTNPLACLAHFSLIIQTTYTCSSLI